MYCNRCRTEFKPFKPCEILDDHVKDFCPRCYFGDRRKSFKNKDTYCIYCGDVLPKYKYTHSTGKTIITSARSRYCKNCIQLHGGKNMAHIAVKKYPEDIIVLYEHPCKSKMKINHHPDYNKPLEVVKMCRSCHVFEHISLKKEACEQKKQRR